MQAASPALPLVSRQRRDVEMTVDPSLFERIGVRLGIATEAGSAVFEFPAAVADEHEFDLLFETRCIVDVIRADAAAAEDATWENVSGLARVITLVCMPPMDSPAMARCGRSANVR